MIPLTLGQVAELVGGVLSPGTDATARVSGPVVADSRQAGPGGLFVAIAGARVDGHDYAADAVAAGAVAVLAGREVGTPAVVVDDPVAALGRLARGVLARLPHAVVVGVTGSAGKTSTKDLLADVLAPVGPTVSATGSLNTEVGLPLTVLRADEATRVLVLEYSARGVGHIAYLCGVARPRVGVLLNVGHAHLGEFGSREQVALAKGELFEALPDDGLAVVNADDRLVLDAAGRTTARRVTFGRDEQATYRAVDIRLDDRARASFRLVTPAGAAAVTLAVHGEHFVSGALATAAVAVELGRPLDEVAARLSAATVPSRWRMEVVDRADGVTVVNDAYNASPESVRAALRALTAIGRGRRTWAVLGEMRELGDAAREQHLAVGRLAAQLGVDRVVAVGAAAPVADGAGADRAVVVADPDAALALLRAQVEPGDVVLVKASRAVGLERVAGALLGPAVGAVR